MSLFEHSKYLSYLKFRLEKGPGPQRGAKSAFARALQCDGAYVSRILDESTYLSFEQGLKANSFFGHTTEESEYFLMLIGKARAGTKELVAYFDSKAQELKKQHLNISHRLKTVEAFSAEIQSQYYSNWLYTAVDLATSIPKLQTIHALSEYFKLSATNLLPTLEFLRKIGVLEQRDEKWVNTNRSIHLSEGSPFLKNHHMNWRLKALQLITEGASKAESENLHYTSAISLSSADLEKIKQVLIKTITEIRSVVKESKDEVLAVYNIDLFKV